MEPLVDEEAAAGTRVLRRRVPPRHEERDQKKCGRAHAQGEEHPAHRLLVAEERLVEHRDAEARHVRGSHEAAEEIGAAQQQVRAAAAAAVERAQHERGAQVRDQDSQSVDHDDVRIRRPGESRPRHHGKRERDVHSREQRERAHLRRRRGALLEPGRFRAHPANHSLARGALCDMDPTSADMGLGRGRAHHGGHRAQARLGGRVLVERCLRHPVVGRSEEGLAVVFMAQTPGPIRWHYRYVINALVEQAIVD